MTIVKQDTHSKSLETLDIKARLALILMIETDEKCDKIRKLDYVIRQVRRRWDELVPPNHTERRSFEPELVKKRASWDSWFQRFMSGALVTVDEMNKHIDIVNGSKRAGVPEREKIQKFGDVDSDIIDSPNRNQETNKNHGNEDTEIEELEKRLFDLKLKKEKQKSQQSEKRNTQIDVSQIPKIPSPALSELNGRTSNIGIPPPPQEPQEFNLADHRQDE